MPLSRPNSSTPVLPIFAVTGLASLGTAVFTNGVSFLTKNSYGFTKTDNYWLGLLLGGTYVAASMTSGRLVTFLRGKVGLSGRAVLALTLVIIGILCFIPQTALALAHGDAKASSWAVWLTIAGYSPLTGLLWPLVEAFLSGGRADAQLRRVMGTWNVVWSASTVGAYWVMGGLHDYPFHMMSGLGGLHILTACLLYLFPSEPGRHEHAAHAPHPPSWGLLLTTFRMLLPASYVVSSALGPYLPEALRRLGITDEWAPVLASSWLFARVITFGTLQRWHGWHGRWSTPIVGGTLVIVGFAGAVLGPSFGTGSIALYAVLAGLFAFGAGMATIYTGAIYYAMEVGNAEVDSGGAHEALIGIGYTVGPLCGLAATGAVNASWINAQAFEPALFTMVAIIIVGAAALVLRRTHRLTAQPR